MKHMTSTEAARRFSQLMRCVQQEPIQITYRDHPRLVMLSAREYERLTRFQLPTEARKPSKVAKDVACSVTPAPKPTRCSRA